MPRKHSILRLFSWHPLVAAVPLAYFIYRANTAGLTVARSVGLCVVSIWFVLAVVDLATGHRYLDWLYSDDDEAG